MPVMFYNDKVNFNPKVGIVKIYDKVVINPSDMILMLKLT